MSSACPWSPVSVYAKRTMADHLPPMKSRNSSSDSTPISTSSSPKRAATRQLVAWSRRVRQLAKLVRKFSAHQLQTIRSAPHETGHGQMVAQLRSEYAGTAAGLG